MRENCTSGSVRGTPGNGRSYRERQKKETTMRNIKATVLTVVLINISGCGSSGPDPKVEACVSRGVAYFKEVGSYPTLKSAPNTGRRAEDVARERCNRTTTAF